MDHSELTEEMNGILHFPDELAKKLHGIMANEVFGEITVKIADHEMHFDSMVMTLTDIAEFAYRKIVPLLMELNKETNSRKKQERTITIFMAIMIGLMATQRISFQAIVELLQATETALKTIETPIMLIESTDHPIEEKLKILDSFFEEKK